MKTQRFLTLLFCILLTAALCRSEASGDGIVHLKPHFVLAGAFDIDGKYDKAGKMILVKVTYVSPKLEKVGLKTGDQLKEIDGLPLIQFSLLDFHAIMNEDLGAGQKRVFTFSCYRWFGKQRLLTITFTGSAEKAPNKAPEPTTPAVTPAADAAVAPAGVAAHL